jgi:hypothetical protein
VASESLIPPGNLPPVTLATFVVEDFHAAWDAMAAASPAPGVGGNFMFARQALGYLELAARTAMESERTLNALSARLADRDPRYFTELPGPVPVPPSDELALPAGPGAPERQLLAALFDLARHGLSHIYQQTPVQLSDGKRMMFGFSGVSSGRPMSLKATPDGAASHLDFFVSDHGHVCIAVRPDQLLRDLEWAARASSVFSGALVPTYLDRPRRRGRRAQRGPSLDPYVFSSAALVRSLEAGGHTRRLDLGPVPGDRP